MASIYIVSVKDSDTGETYNYEYGCLDHAIVAYNAEESALMVEHDCKTGKDYLVCNK